MTNSKAVMAEGVQRRDDTLIAALLHVILSRARDLYP